MTENLYSILEDAAKRWPNKVAISDEWGSLSFLEFFQQTELLRQKLIDLGAKKGQGLCLIARNGRYFLQGLFAGLGVGATVMPVSHQSKASELEKILKEAPVHVILNDQSGVSYAQGISTLIPNGGIEYSFTWTGTIVPEVFVPHIENAAFVRFSSGTTGTAKGVVLSHKSVFERIEAANKGLNLSEDDTVAWVMPMAFHFMASLMLYVRFGVHIAVCKDILAENIIEMANNTRAKMLYAAPFHLRLLASDKSNAKFKTLKTVISTSSGISTTVMDAFHKRFGLLVSQAYGIIELGLPLINSSKNSAEHPQSVGKPLSDFEVECMLEDGTIAPRGVIGNLMMRGPGMFDGYLKPAVRREALLRNGWFDTGDLASKDDEGLVSVRGRRKSMINVSGNKVFPEEVEDTLNEYPGVLQSLVYGKTHPIFGEIVHADVCLERGGEPPKSEQIIKFCRERLSTYKVPQSLSFVDSVVRTATGKIMRALPEQLL